MRKFAQLRPGFWTGATGRQLRRLGPEFQLVALYLISAHGSNALGLYYLPLPTAAHETGLPIEKVRKILQKLREMGFCDYDEESEMVFVINMAHFQIGEYLTSKDKQVPWVWHELQKLRDCVFFDRFLDRYGEAFKVAEYFRKDPSKDLRSIETENGNPEMEREMGTGNGPGHGEGVARGNQGEKPQSEPGVLEGTNSPLDMETVRAQRRLEKRRAMIGVAPGGKICRRGQ